VLLRVLLTLQLALELWRENATELAVIAREKDFNLPLP
jgi:hypothetical protein